MSEEEIKEVQEGFGGINERERESKGEGEKTANEI